MSPPIYIRIVSNSGIILYPQKQKVKYFFSTHLKRVLIILFWRKKRTSQPLTGREVLLTPFDQKIILFTIQLHTTVTAGVSTLSVMPSRISTSRIRKPLS